MRNTKDIERFNEALERLNALNSPHMKWHLTSARKSHKDEFGQTIEEGEDYFSITLPGAFASYLRLSHKSMEKFLELLFTCGPILKDLAEIRLNEQAEQGREAVRKMAAYSMKE